MHLICNVAPLVGAWIERSNTALKALGVFRVAPLVGAWIERRETLNKRKEEKVAPLVGAWIESRLFTV